MLSEKSRRKIISKINPIVLAMINALIGKQKNIIASVTGMEKWNFPRRVDGVFLNDPPCKIPNVYDIEGHAWTDVVLHRKLSFTSFSDIKYLWNEFKEISKDIYKIWTEKSPKVIPWKLSFWKTNIVYSFKLLKTVDLYQSKWTWTVQSFSVLKDDIISEMMIEHGHDSNKCTALTEVELGLKLTRKEILTYLNKHYIKINGFMWVAKTDPTTITVDQHTVPYDLKDGYSNLEILSIIESWFLELFLKNVSIVESTKNIHDTKVTRGVIIGLCDTARGDVYTSEEVFSKWQNTKK